VTQPRHESDLLLESLVGTDLQCQRNRVAKAVRRSGLMYQFICAHPFGRAQMLRSNHIVFGATSKP
jgi:hypothetical protein